MQNSSSPRWPTSIVRRRATVRQRQAGESYGIYNKVTGQVFWNGIQRACAQDAVAAIGNPEIDYGSSSWIQDFILER
jgi:hypothetical protein